MFAKYDDAVRTVERGAPSPDDAKLLDLSATLFDNDAARRASIDNRASALMPAITIAVTLVSGVGFTALRDGAKGSPIAAWCIFITYLLVLIYLSRTVLLTFRILGILVRYTPDPTDVVPPTRVAGVKPRQAPADAQVQVSVEGNAAAQAQPPSAYAREYAVKLLRYTIGNYKANNQQTDALSVAQRSFRNALIVLVAGGCITAALYMLTSQHPRVRQSLAGKPYASGLRCASASQTDPVERLLSRAIFHRDRHFGWYKRRESPEASLRLPRSGGTTRHS